MSIINLTEDKSSIHNHTKSEWARVDSECYKKITHENLDWDNVEETDILIKNKTDPFDIIRLTDVKYIGSKWTILGMEVCSGVIFPNYTITHFMFPSLYPPELWDDKHPDYGKPCQVTGK